MRVSGIPLGISGREDSVNKDKSANNLSPKAITLGVAMVNNIGSTSQKLILVLLEALHNTCTSNSTKGLHDYVENSSCKGEFPCQEETKGHSWVDVSTCYMQAQRSGYKRILSQKCNHERKPIIV